jgi:hypothetical protein
LSNNDLSDKKANAEYLERQKRKCHDCHRPTWNYRCAECDAKHKKKHGVTGSANDYGE